MVVKNNCSIERLKRCKFNADAEITFQRGEPNLRTVRVAVVLGTYAVYTHNVLCFILIYRIMHERNNRNRTERMIPNSVK